MGLPDEVIVPPAAVYAFVMMSETFVLEQHGLQIFQFQSPWFSIRETDVASSCGMVVVDGSFTASEIRDRTLTSLVETNDQ